MRNEIFYFNSARMDRSLTNLCSGNSADKLGIKQKFYILPDRQMSFLKILDLPPAPENKLRDMVRFQMLKIYPGNTEDVSFDFIPFKTETGWKIVLYILKKKYLNEVMGNDRFGCIVLPLQLLTKKELQSLLNLIIHYPDMVEKWSFVNGIPDRIERRDLGSFSVQDSLSQENDISNPEKLMTICSCNELPESGIENGRIKRFSETLGAIRKNGIFFPEHRVIKSDRLTPFITIAAFILSLVLLAITASKHHDLVRAETEVDSQIANVRIETAQNQEALEIIEKLDNELKQIRENIPINVYNLLLRTSKAIDSNTVVLSLEFKNKELSLTLNSSSAVDDLEGIKDEFGNVRASNIRTLDDGSENYTVRVEIEQ